MSLQFLTNDNPPPAQSLLQYDVEPGVVFLSHDGQDFYANLTITVFNPTNNAVDCMEFQFGFLAGAPSGNLTTPTAAGEVTASDQNDWSITNEGSFSGSGNPNLYLFTATPSGISDYSELTGGRVSNLP